MAGNQTLDGPWRTEYWAESGFGAKWSHCWVKADELCWQVMG